MYKEPIAFGEEQASQKRYMRVQPRNDEQG